MAFSFDTFVKDQKQAAIDVVDTITPRQIKQVGAAYKEGLNASPKNVINETQRLVFRARLDRHFKFRDIGAILSRYHRLARCHSTYNSVIIH